MSQVIVTEDNLKNRRLKSGAQERQIDREGQFQQWRRSDITGFDPFLLLFQIVMLPLVFSWYLIGLLVKFAIYVSIGTSRAIGALLGPSKSE